MKYILANRFSGVTSFAAFNGSFFFITQEDKLFVDGKYMYDCFAISKTTYFLIGYPNDKKSSFTLDRKNSLHHYSESISPRGITEDSALILESSTDLTSGFKIGIFPFKTKQINWLNGRYKVGSSIRIFDHFVYINTIDFSLSCLNLNTGKIIWNTSNELCDLFNAIQSEKDNILIYNENYEYWIIKAENGFIKQHICPFNSKEISKRFFLNFPILNQDKLTFFERQYLVETNLNTGHTEWKWHEPNHNIAASVVIDNYIYFLDSSEFFPNAFGIFDREKNEIIHWQHVDLPKFGMLTQKPVVCEDKIYLRDDQKNLYIYQRVE